MSKAGTHLARACAPEAVKFGMSSNNNLQIAITFHFTNPDDTYFGQSIAWISSFAPGKASEITLEAMENCGWSGEDVMDMTDIDKNEVELVIIEEWNQDQTKKFEKVAFVNRRGTARFTFQKPMEGNELAAQSRLVAQSIRAIRASQGRTRSASTRPQTKQQPPQQQQRPTQNGDDEFPF